MTQRIPGAWVTCACGRRMRPNNPYGQCWLCERGGPKRRAERLPSAPPDGADEAAYAEYLIAYQAAVLRGHDLASPERDDGFATFITYCLRCDGFLVADPVEEDCWGKPTPFYGRAYLTDCPGEPPVRPALRRSEFDEAAPSTLISDMPVGVENTKLATGLPTDKDGWAWDNDESSPWKRSK